MNSKTLLIIKFTWEDTWKTVCRLLLFDYKICDILLIAQEFVLLFSSKQGMLDIYILEFSSTALPFRDDS